MKLILHIGPEKTGTSSLQQFLLVNREVLIQHGICFPSDDEILDQTLGNCFGLALFSGARNVIDFKKWSSVFSQISQTNYDEMFECSLVELLAGAAEKSCHTIILSNEHLASRLNSEDIGKLSSFLLRYFKKVEIVTYLRKQEEAIISLYSTYIRSGGTSKFSSNGFLNNHSDYINEQYDYSKLLERWSHFFGKTNMIVRIYTREILKDFISYLLPDIVDTEQEFIFPANKINQSLSIKQLNWIRALNTANCFLSNKGPLFRSIYRIFHVLGYKYFNYFLQNQSSTQSFGLLSEIKSRFDDSNKVVAAEYFDRTQLFL